MEAKDPNVKDVEPDTLPPSTPGQVFVDRSARGGSVEMTTLFCAMTAGRHEPALVGAKLST